MWINNFIWMGDTQKKGLVTINWKDICKPATERGLGIRSLEDINNAGMSKLAWWFLKGQRQWCDFMKNRYYRKGRPISYSKSSSIWKGIKEGLLLLNPDVFYILGSNSKCSFWGDRWLNGRKISEYFSIRPELEHTRHHTVAQICENGTWNLPMRLTVNMPLLATEIREVEFSSE